MSIALEQVLLRPLDEQDIAALYQYRNDPYITSALVGFSTGYSHKDLADWLEFHRTCKNEVLWCIADKKSDACLGHVGLYQIDHRVRKAEFGILIGDQNKRGQGLGYSVCSAIIEYARDQLNIRRIELSLLATNTAAEKLYLKLGFEREGVLKQAQFRDGAYQDTVLMALLLD